MCNCDNSSTFGSRNNKFTFTLLSVQREWLKYNTVHHNCHHHHRRHRLRLTILLVSGRGLHEVSTLRCPRLAFCLRQRHNDLWLGFLTHLQHSAHCHASNRNTRCQQNQRSVLTACLFVQGTKELIYSQLVLSALMLPSVLSHCWSGGRKGIRPVKNNGDGGGGHWLVRMEWRPAGWSVCLPLLIFPCTIKSRSSLLAPAHPGGPGKRAVKRLWWCGLSALMQQGSSGLQHVKPCIWNPNISLQ